jgi:hypothetical protein
VAVEANGLGRANPEQTGGLCGPRNQLSLPARNIHYASSRASVGLSTSSWLAAVFSASFAVVLVVTQHGSIYSDRQRGDGLGLCDDSIASPVRQLLRGDERS